MPKPLKIGLTGGLGSGKTYVSEIFKVLGIPIFYADEVSKNIISADPLVRKEILENFGNEVFDERGLLNRRALGNLVFKDVEKLNILNKILHPKVFEAFNIWSAQQSSPYLIKEAAILFESGSNKGLDYIITVSSPLPLRLKRVLSRDNCSEEEFTDRITRQLTEEERLDKSDFVIINDDEHLLIPQVHELHEKLIEINA